MKYMHLRIQLLNQTSQRMSWKNGVSRCKLFKLAYNFGVDQVKVCQFRLVSFEPLNLTLNWPNQK